jgi:prephenate dehydratase
MTISIGYLGPRGTFSEQASLAYQAWLQSTTGVQSTLQSYPSIFQTIQSVVDETVVLAIAPVENSIEGSVAVTLDALWQLDSLRIQQALVLPIHHALISHATNFAALETIYSHPQALGQCQQWIARHCPQVTLVPTRSTAESLQYPESSTTAAAIASEGAAQLYAIPVLAASINDQPDNCTKFWILGTQEQTEGSHTSLAFSLPVNAPGALLRPLEVLAKKGINLSRIESRPTKRSLGEYLFFLDLEASLTDPQTQIALEALTTCTETLKLFGSYTIIPVAPTSKVTD